jgi:hypothetical protein
VSYLSALSEVHKEILRARATHGEENFHSAHEGFAVLDEERDELWDEVKRNPLKGIEPCLLCRTNFEHDAHKQYLRDEHRKTMKKEAIQLAAMAVRFIVEVCHE